MPGFKSLRLLVASSTSRGTTSTSVTAATTTTVTTEATSTTVLATSTTSVVTSLVAGSVSLDGLESIVGVSRGGGLIKQVSISNV